MLHQKWMIQQSQKLKAEVSASVTKTYAETIFTSIGTMSDGFAEASDGTQQLSDGMNSIRRW